MKTRIIIIFILLLVLALLLSHNNQKIENALLNIINPIKQNYKLITQDLENKSQSYLFQQETIEKLRKENLILRKRLLEQVHYIKQVKDIYEALPQLSRLPVDNISIVETISYVKLNSFSQIILTKPKTLQNQKLYGLIQGTVAAGIATIKNNQLYGYLISDNKCRFSVNIGQAKAPGIAIGLDKNTMKIKFIPKWHKISVGDRVVTSGMDDIFFADIPVGVVTKVELQSAYTVAYIKTYSDVYHPKTFFLINNAQVDLVQQFDSNDSNITPYYIKKQDYFKLHKSSDINETNQTIVEHNDTLPIISSIPTREDIVQTKDDIVEPEIPEEETKPKPIQKPKKARQRRKRKKPQKSHSTLDLF